MTRRKVHILTRERFGDLLLGPQIRLEKLAEEFEARGCEPTIYGHLDESRPGTHRFVKSLQPGFTRQIAPSDVVVASELLQSKPSHELLQANLRFHWDCYGLSLPETLAFLGKWTYLRSLADRRRKLIRYRIMASRSESIWVSNLQQGAFLAALLATSVSSYDASTANDLPSKTILAPMGLKSEAAATGLPNPYPSTIQNRPIFLWGGGIWPWFDIETVLHAMSHVKDDPSSPCLFFISGRNEATSDYDAPLQKAIALSQQLGLLDKQVFFNDRRVGSSELASWLEHSTAGIMGSPSSLESQLSWRTRYLDLLWSGRPLVCSGQDPLALLMAEQGAALVTEAGNSDALASSILKYASKTKNWQAACSASARLGEQLTWTKTLGPAVDRALSTPGSKSQHPRLLALTKARYLLGI